VAWSYSTILPPKRESRSGGGHGGSLAWVKYCLLRLGMSVLMMEFSPIVTKREIGSWEWDSVCDFDSYLLVEANGSFTGTGTCNILQAVKRERESALF